VAQNKNKKRAITTRKREHDHAWKDILDLYFPKFIEFFYPQLYRQIDWSRQYQSLDKELQKITRKSVVGRRYVDKLMQVYSHTGKSNRVLAHLEVQEKGQANFSERLFEYFCGLHLHYKESIITLAILIDGNPNWRPTDYRLSVLGLPVNHFQFYTVKLTDYRGQEEALLNHDNPFAWVVLVQLTALEVCDDRQRLQKKLSLTRLLHQRNFTQEEIIKLYLFIDWILTLPEDLEVIYNDAIKHIEEELNMPFISGMERLGIAKGREEGMEEGLRKGKQEGLKLAKVREKKKMLIAKAREKKKMLKIAKGMRAIGSDRATIARLTGLSDSELDELFQKH
jgi:hypothetical protein